MLRFTLTSVAVACGGQARSGSGPPEGFSNGLASQVSISVKAHHKAEQDRKVKEQVLRR
jgi:hypothetical protein